MSKSYSYVRKVLLIVSGFILAVALFSSCSSEEKPKPIIYDGPLSEAEEITMYYTKKDRMEVLLKAKKINEFQNGDREFPEGIYIEFYDANGKIRSTLKANSAYYFKSEDKWRGQGNVEVINIEKQEQLNTEELFWTPSTKKIFTDKFVTVRQESEVIYGTGLEANEDLSSYTMKKISGDFEVKE